MNQLGGIGEPHALQNQLAQRGCRPPTIRLAHDGCQRATSDPEPAALVAQDVPPPARARGVAAGIPAVRDRAGAGDEDHSRRVAGARGERDERVIDDERAHLESDPFHDPANGFCVLRPIDARDAQADGLGPDLAIADCRLHDVVENLLHLELADRLQVGAAAARFGEDDAAFVRQQAHGLGTAGVDAEHVHPVEFYKASGPGPQAPGLSQASGSEGSGLRPDS